MANSTYIDVNFCPSLHPEVCKTLQLDGYAAFVITGSTFQDLIGYSEYKEFATRPTKRQIRKFKRKLRKAEKVDIGEFD